MTGTVTVGYDGSATSSAALRWAADQAALRGAALQIVSCYRIPVAAAGIEAWPAAESAVALLAVAEQQALAARDMALVEHPELTVTTEVSAGPASAVLVDGAGPGDL